MKVIDLLNKIAKGEEVPKKIRISHWCYNFKWVEHLDNYYDEDADLDLMSCLSMDGEELNYEVEIIEEDKKIEKLDIHQEKNCKNNWKWQCNGYNISTPQKIIGEKLNEVIDKLNEMEENK